MISQQDMTQVIHHQTKPWFWITHLPWYLFWTLSQIHLKRWMTSWTCIYTSRRRTQTTALFSSLLTRQTLTWLNKTQEINIKLNLKKKWIRMESILRTLTFSLLRSLTILSSKLLARSFRKWSHALQQYAGFWIKLPTCVICKKYTYLI